MTSCSTRSVRPPTRSADTSCHREMSKHCGAVWATTVTGSDLEVVDLREQVVEQARVLTHRPLGLTGGAGGEVDVGELVGARLDAGGPPRVSLP